MEGTRHAMSRRGLLTAVVAGSTIGLAAGSTAAFAASAVEKPGLTAGSSLVAYDSIAGATTRTADGRAVAMAYSPDFHDRLSEWLRFWWANSPGHWMYPLEIVGEVRPSGQAFVLSGIRYTHGDRLHDGFLAGSRTASYWATVASLHHHFPTVQIDPSSGRVYIEDGHAGFSGSADQIDFVRTACRQVWGDATAPSDWRARGAQIIGRADAGGLTSRAGWSAFTRATARRGLGAD